MKRSRGIKSLAVRVHGGAGSCSREWKDVTVVWGYCTRFEFHALGISNICIGARLPFVGGGGGRGGNRENRAPRALISSICRSKCPKNNFDRATSPASSHRTYPSVASHTPIDFIVHTSYSSCVYANHIARMGSCAGVPNIARRTDTLVSPEGISHLFSGIN